MTTPLAERLAALGLPGMAKAFDDQQRQPDVTALTFEALSAPDLALTQLSVEVASTVLLLMGLALLPGA